MATFLFKHINDCLSHNFFCLTCSSLCFPEESLFLFAPGRKHTLQDAEHPQGSFSADTVVIRMVCHHWLACDFIYFAFSQQKQPPLIPLPCTCLFTCAVLHPNTSLTMLQWMSCVCTNSGSDLVKLTFRSRHQ